MELRAEGSSSGLTLGDMKSQDCNLHASPVLFSDFSLTSCNSHPETQQERPGKSKYPYFTEKSPQTKLILKGKSMAKTGPWIVRAGGNLIRRQA